MPRSECPARAKSLPEPLRDVARVMEYEAAFDLYRGDRHVVARDVA
ncbi:MAG: hypothetical protein V3U23_05595 [Kiloniellales bacterium]